MCSQLDIIILEQRGESPTSDGHVNIGGRPFLDKPYSIPLNSPKKDRSRPRCHGKKLEHVKGFSDNFGFPVMIIHSCIYWIFREYRIWIRVMFLTT